MIEKHRNNLTMIIIVEICRKFKIKKFRIRSKVVAKKQKGRNIVSGVGNGGGGGVEEEDYYK